MCAQPVHDGEDAVVRRWVVRRHRYSRHARWALGLSVENQDGTLLVGIYLARATVQVIRRSDAVVEQARALASGKTDR